MRAFGKAILYGALLWAVVFAVALLITPLRFGDRPFFESIMPVALSLSTASAASLALRRASRQPLRQGIFLGGTWLAVNLALDGLMFSWGPMQMGLAEYLKDIGFAYLIIPITTIALGLALERRDTTAGIDGSAGARI